MAMTMASPTATSATVMAMVSMVKTSPPMSARNRANATRLMLTAFSMSSMPSRMPTALRRVRTPKRPMANTSAASMRYACSGTLIFRSREVERAEQGDDEQHGEQLQGGAKGSDEGASEGDHLLAGRRRRRGRDCALDDETEKADEHGGGEHGAVEDVAAGLADGLADQALGEHDGEDHDGDHAAGVEQQLDTEQERRLQEPEDGARGHQRGRQIEDGGVEQVGRQHHTEAPAHQHDGHHPEADGLGHYGFAVGAPSEASGARRSGVGCAVGFAGFGGACMSRRRFPVAHDGSNWSPSACRRSLSSRSSRRSAVARSNERIITMASVGHTCTQSSQNSHEYSSRVKVFAQFRFSALSISTLITWGGQMYSQSRQPMQFSSPVCGSYVSARIPRNRSG